MAGVTGHDDLALVPVAITDLLCNLPLPARRENVILGWLFLGAAQERRWDTVVEDALVKRPQKNDARRPVSIRRVEEAVCAVSFRHGPTLARHRTAHSPEHAP